MKKIILLSIALIMGFFATSAQEKLQRQNVRSEYPDFGSPKLTKIKKIDPGQVWWEPDTVYIYRWYNDSLVNDELYIYTFDSNNNMLSKLFQSRGNNSWENVHLFTYTYDSNNNILSELQQNWDNNSWINGYYHNQFSYTYDSNNNMLTKLHQSWSNNSWKNSELYTYTYDSNNNLQTELNQTWVNNSWVNSIQKIYTYGTQNNMLTKLQQSWINNSWINNSMYTYTYDSNNNIQIELLQNWLDNNSWRNYALFTYTYDSNNNMLVRSQQTWANNSWVNGVQYLMTYDENMNGISGEWWKWENESWQPSSNGTAMINLWLYYNNMKNAVEEVSGDKMTASYIKVSRGNTGIADTKTALPTQIHSVGKTIYVDNPTGKDAVVSVYGIAGVKVAEQTMVNKTIALEMPVSGFYLVSVKAGNEKPLTEKIIVR